MDSYTNIFIVGIKGAAMVNIAVILKKMGKTVTGSDIEEEFITDILLKKNNIPFTVGFDPLLLTHGIDLVIYSAGHGGRNNPQVKEAEKRGIKTISQAAFLSLLMEKFKIKIAVSGCHGKTTTSSLLSHALIQLGKKPSYLVGSPFFGEYAGGDFNSLEYFVIEADEYGVNPPENIMPKFHLLHPDWIICTNIDFDHPDIYKDLEDTKRAFLTFFGSKKLILCSDNDVLSSLLPQLVKNEVYTYGFDAKHKPTLLIENASFEKTHTTFSAVYKGTHIGSFSLLLAGEKNILNAAAVILQLLSIGIEPDAIREAISHFNGAKRRFELVGEKNGVILYDDYAHHPHEIEATLQAARSKYKNRRILAIFQPHTFSRTLALKSEFAQALSLADQSFILPVFPSARERAADYPVTSIDIEKEANKKGNKTVKSYADSTVLLASLRKFLRPGDIVFTMGAGDIYKLKDDIIECI